MPESSVTSDEPLMTMRSEGSVQAKWADCSARKSRPSPLRSRVTELVGRNSPVVGLP